MRQWVPSLVPCCHLQPVSKLWTVATRVDYLYRSHRGGVTYNWKTAQMWLNKSKNDYYFDFFSESDQDRIRFQVVSFEREVDFCSVAQITTPKMFSFRPNRGVVTYASSFYLENLIHTSLKKKFCKVGLDGFLTVQASRWKWDFMRSGCCPSAIFLTVGVQVKCSAVRRKPSNK